MANAESVDSAIKKKMQGILDGQIDPYSEDCAFVAQAEYFDPPYGITLPVDNRLFPDSTNQLFDEHGYDMEISENETGRKSEKRIFWVCCFVGFAEQCKAKSLQQAPFWSVLKRIC